MTQQSPDADYVEDLALACLERLADEGESVVDRVCAAHPDLADRVRGVLRQLKSVGLVDTSSAPPTYTLGDFRLVRKLGEGGMGVVWLAEQTSLQRRVALKLLRPGFALQDRLRDRFRREVKALSKLDHPNICTVYEAGEIDGTPYLAMRYIEGQNLHDQLRVRREASQGSRRTTVTQSSQELFDQIHLVEKLARALHTAHLAGVVHRDVKPGNVLIDAAGEPVLVDFGLAHEEDPTLSVLTTTGQPVGTPPYMSPEQITGHGSVDARTDVYALGALLYECLTLQTPFDGPTRDSLYHSILHDPVPNPHRRNHGVGADLRAVLEKALEKDPHRRFGSALEFADELRRIRRHEPVLTHRTGPVLRTVRWCQRNRAVTAVLAAVTAALAVSTWLLWRSERAERRSRALALLAAANSEAAAHPQLAFWLAREGLELALQADPTDVAPLLVGDVQRLMSGLQPGEVIRDTRGPRLQWLGFSPDRGRRFLVLSGWNARPSLHRGRDGRPLFEFPQAMPGQQGTIAFDPVAQRLAIADRVGTVHVYALQDDWLQDGRAPRTPPPPVARIETGKGVRGVVWSPDGTLLATGYRDGSAAVWRSDGSGLRKELLPVDPSIDKRNNPQARPWHTVAFLPDGRLVAAGAIWSRAFADPRILRRADGRVAPRVQRITCTEERILTMSLERPGASLWDHAGEHLAIVGAEQRQRNAVMHTAFAPDGRTFAVSFINRIELRDALDGKLVTELSTGRHASAIRFDFSPDGKQLASSHFGGAVLVWDIQQRSYRHLAGHLGEAFWIGYTGEGASLVSVSWDGTARRWDLGVPYPGVSSVLDNNLAHVTIADRGVVVATGRGELLLCDPDDGRVLHRGKAGEEPLGMVRVATDPGGNRVVAASMDSGAWTWDLGNDGPPGKPVHVPGTSHFTYAADFLADGNLLVLSITNFKTYLQAGERLVQRPDEAAIGSLAISDDGTKALEGTLRDGVRVLELRGGKLERIAELPLDPDQSPASLAFTNGDTEVLIGTWDGGISRWNIAERRRVTADTPHHRSPVFAVAASPSGRRIATASWGGKVRVRNADGSGRPLVLSTMDSRNVNGIVWLDEDRLVTSGGGGARWMWVDAEKLYQAIKVIKVKEPTAEELAPHSHLLDR